MNMTKTKKATAVLKEYGLLFVMALLVVIVAIIQPLFLNYNNILNIMRQISVLGIVSLGLTIVIIGGYMDLSVSGTISLVAVVTISLQENFGVAASVGIGLLVGLIIGLINAAIILFVRAGNGESLIITFGTQSVIGAAALLFSKGYSLRAPSESGLRVIGQGTVGPVAISILIFLALAVLLQFFMSRTRYGRCIYLIGGNREACRLSAIPTAFYVALVYVISGVMAAMAGIVLCARTMSATPTMGTGYDMDAIMAVVIGGTSLAGGKGSAFKTIAGVLLVGVMTNALNIIGVTSNMQFIVKGCIMVIAVWIDSRKN